MNRAVLFLCLAATTFSGCARRDVHFSKTLSGQAVMIGCLNPGTAPNTYVLTDYKTGQPVPVSGHGDLKLHASNHAVKLVGSYKNQAEGLRVVRIDDIAVACKTPFPANLPQSAAQRP